MIKKKYKVKRHEKAKLLHSRNFQKFGFDFHPQVSLVSAGLLLTFMLCAILIPDQTNAFLGDLKGKVIGNWDWLFIMASNLFLIVPIILFFSKFGEIRIGGPEAKPEFGNFAWYSMLLSAGMGIGLMFYGVGEPMFHMQEALGIFDGAKGEPEKAMAATFLHWGIHPWGIYCLISLALAFFAYNRGLPLSLRSVFYPIFKDKVFGWIGDLIDISAVLACLVGLATSLGFGAKQINSGLNHLFDVPVSSGVQVTIIIVITLVATLSVVSGIGKGVRILSELNLRVAGIFMLIVFLIGPTLYILRLFSNSVSEYAQNIVDMGFWVETGDSTWQSSWTVLYLAWWISWSPFVGLFIARISKGRTVREFVAAVLLIPSILCFMWMTVFGGSAIEQSLSDGGALMSAVSNDISIALYALIDGMTMPFADGALKMILSLIATFLVISFFVTSSDSGSLVVDNLTSGGKLDSPVPQRVFWAFMEGAIAVALILAGGEDALGALQTGVIITGLPFTLILMIMCYSLFKGLNNDFKQLKAYRVDQLAEKIFNEKIHGEFENNEKIRERMNR